MSALDPLVAIYTLTIPRTMRKRDMIKLLGPLLKVIPGCIPLLVLLAQKSAAGVDIKPIIEAMVLAAGP